ncbi:DUF2500 domain-containing protein [Neobacillus sp. D3-1R]|uniref:DUF2500 domain-containing protein n=1 Tax=Neobacillus sp. D3-1R TaxID=3445778 RepID=UPI003F9EE55D
MGIEPMGMFSFFSAIFPIFFLFVFGFIIFQIFKGVKQWNYNNQQPVLTVNAKLVSKRTHVSRHAHNHDNHVHHHSSTSYFLTFEFDSGDRLELKVSDHDYGQYIEGDFGNLTFQGTRYLKFERWKG